MSIRKDLEIPLTMLSLSFLNELPYKGSYNGRRFMFERFSDNNELSESIKKSKDEKVLKNNFILKVYIWKDFLNFENTKKTDMIVKDFEYSKNGINQGIDFVEMAEI